MSKIIKYCLKKPLPGIHVGAMFQIAEGVCYYRRSDDAYFEYPLSTVESSPEWFEKIIIHDIQLGDFVKLHVDSDTDDAHEYYCITEDNIEMFKNISSPSLEIITKEEYIKNFEKTIEKIGFKVGERVITNAYIDGFQINFAEQIIRFDTDNKGEMYVIIRNPLIGGKNENLKKKISEVELVTQTTKMSFVKK